MSKPARTSSIPPVTPVSKAGLRQRLLVWYLRVGIGMIVLAVVFGSKLTTPVHADLSGEWVVPLTRWGLACVLAAIATGIAAALLRQIHRPGGDIGEFVAATLLFCGVFLISAESTAEGVNVHFASAPATRVTAKILRIDPASPGGRSPPTVYLAYWGADNPARVVSASMNGRIFRTDMDKKYATFHVREGFLGIPYASEFK